MDSDRKECEWIPGRGFKWLSGVQERRKGSDGGVASL